MAVNYDCKGKISEIQEFCSVCGPGLRTVIKMKGSPLSLQCEKKENYIEETVTVDEVMDKLIQDKVFFSGSGGGMTIAGEEPLMQDEFSVNLLAASKFEGIRTAIKSCNFASKEIIDKVYADVDYAIADIYCMDSAVHEKLTGVKNDGILENIGYIHNDLKIQMNVNVPIAYGYNCSLDNIEAIAAFIRDELGDDVTYSLEAVQAEGLIPVSEEHIGECDKVFEKYGIKKFEIVQI